MRKKKSMRDNFSFGLQVVKENPDGSADCIVNMSDAVRDILVERGIIAILQDYINQQKEKKNGSA